MAARPCMWLVVSLAACNSHRDRARDRLARAAHEARDAAVTAVTVVPIDAAPPCPGKAEDCTACAAGSAAGCTLVAYSDHVPDRDKGAWYQRGCDGGDIDGCDGLSWYYIFVVTDHERYVAAEARRVALVTARHATRGEHCAAHDEDACMDAALDTYFGFGTAKDPAAGTAQLVASCERGGMRSCMSIAQTEELPRATRAKYGTIACTLGEEMTCGDLLGVFGHPPLAPGAATIVRGQLDRMCKARDAYACWVLAGTYWTRDHGKAGAAIAAACALEAKWCDEQVRFAHGEPFLEDHGALPLLDVKPLLDAAKHAQQRK